MKNLGKANAIVKILNALPYIDKNAKRFNFEVSAFNWDLYVNSPYFTPLLTDEVHDDLESFSACFPSKRKMYMDNFLKTSSGTLGNPTTNPYITFKATTTVEGHVKDVFSTYNQDTLVQPGNYTTDTSYAGPKWSPAPQPALSTPNDLLLIQAFYQSFGLSAPTPPPTSTAANVAVAQTNYMQQEKVGDGMWWGLESEDFLTENMPFYVTLKVTQAPPTQDHDTCFFISLGLKDDSQAYDIYLSYNNKPVIYDYPEGRGSTSSSQGTAPVNAREFDDDLSKFLVSQEEINIGVMTIAGRLVVFVNEVPLVYTRIEQSDNQNSNNPGTVKEAKIAKGAIRVYGSNVQCIVNVCPMTFAPLAALALPIPVVSQGNSGQGQITYQGVRYDGEPGGPVCKLPTQPDSKDELFGVDCEKFTGDGGTAQPTGVGFHSAGTVRFQKAQNTGITGNNGSDDFYVLSMESVNTVMGNQAANTIYYGACPFFFRLKGAAERPATLAGGAVTIVPEVISATYNSNAPDYFHAVATASITIYNKGGMYDYLRDSQYGVTLSFGWGGGKPAPIFTGMIMSTSTSEEPGKETITLQCEDYMTVLKNTPIVNSPFYDGMVGYYAIADLAKRAGIMQFKKDWNGEREYFLPSGYSFSKPAYRFESRQSIFDCVMQVVKRFEAFVYFDANGVLHVHRLPGGLFSQVTSISGSFYRDPMQNYSNIILNEKTAEYSFTSTSNTISCYTLDRDTRNPILYNYSNIGNDILLYRRVALYDSPSLGDLESATVYVQRLAQRVFHPIRKTNFTTVGSGTNGLIKALDFVTVDGDEYRVTSIGMKYDANSNDFTSQYSCEWLGG